MCVGKAPLSTNQDDKNRPQTVITVRSEQGLSIKHLCVPSTVAWKGKTRLQKISAL